MDTTKVSPSKCDFPSRVVDTPNWTLNEGNCGDVICLVALMLTEFSCGDEMIQTP